MSPATKIGIGATLTVLLAWILHGPLQFGAACQAAAVQMGAVQTATFVGLTPPANDIVTENGMAVDAGEGQ